jgi:hypothetical protein
MNTGPKAIGSSEEGASHEREATTANSPPETSDVSVADRF